MAALWQLLEVKEEEELHKSRLLNIEEKSFKRIIKRLTPLESTASALYKPTPLPLSGNAVPNNINHHPPESLLRPSDLEQMKQDIILDFAAFDSHIARLQFHLAANDRERTRYALDRTRILDSCQAVRDNTAALRTQLDQARTMLAQRRKFDDLAEQILRNRQLRSRSDQHAALRKLDDECAQLAAERDAYTVTWRERRAQFNRIMEESMRLRRLIRDEHDEVDRREGMDDGQDGEADADAAADGARTPRPESSRSNNTKLGQPPRAGTPKSTSRRTPLRDRSRSRSCSPWPQADRLRKPATAATGTSRARRDGPRDAEQVDVEMGNVDGLVAASTPAATHGTPRVVVADGQDDLGDKMDTS